jgi:hypothetical protein
MSDELLHGKRQPSEWWFVGVLVFMLGVLMASHIGMLWVRVIQCDRYAEIRMGEARERINMPPGSMVPLAPSLPAAELCKALTNDFNSVANLYLATILALLSGAGFSAGKASVKPEKPQRSDQP